MLQIRFEVLTDERSQNDIIGFDLGADAKSDIRHTFSRDLNNLSLDARSGLRPERHVQFLLADVRRQFVMNGDGKLPASRKIRWNIQSDRIGQLLAICL